MRHPRTIAAWISAAALAGCSPEVGPSARATAEPPQVPTAATQRPVEAPPPPPSGPAPAPPAPPAFAQTELAPAQGDLVPLLKIQFERAKAKGLTPYVEFYAEWCPPCMTLLRAMEQPVMMEAFRGTYIVKLNLDDWHDKLKGTGFEPKFIPAIYGFGADGRPNGRSFVASTWGKKTTVESMAATLRGFFGG